MKFLSKHVVHQIVPKWLEVGLELLSSEDEARLYAIRATYHDATNCTSEMLRLWLDRNPKASWNQLLEALREVHYNTLAETLKDMLYKGKLISI